MRKQKAFYFKSIFHLAILTALLLPATVMSQQNRAETRKEKRARDKAEQLKKYEKARQLIVDSTFVVPADNILLGDGTFMTPAQRTINFLKMNGDEAVIQVGSDFARTRGLNSLGGVTLKGKVSNLKIKEKENKHRLFMTFTLTGLIGTARISLSLTGSDRAVVDVDGMFSGRAFSLRGPVQPLSETNIFEGTEF